MDINENTIMLPTNLIGQSHSRVENVMRTNRINEASNPDCVYESVKLNFISLSRQLGDKIYRKGGISKYSMTAMEIIRYPPTNTNVVAATIMGF